LRAARGYCLDLVAEQDRALAQGRMLDPNRTLDRSVCRAAARRAAPAVPPGPPRR
jgi:hypothetical protein